MKKIIIVLLLFISPLVVVFADDDWTIYTTENGLPDPVVRIIAIDNNNVKWMKVTDVGYSEISFIASWNMVNNSVANLVVRSACFPV